MRGASRAEPEEGYAWHADIVPDDFCTSAAASPEAEIARSEVCAADGTLKLQRKPPIIFRADLLAMTSTSLPSDAVLRGSVNGWGAITNTMLMSITCQRGAYVWRHSYAPKAEETTFADVISNAFEDAAFDPNCPSPLQPLRMRIALPPWSAVGWSPMSPGFVWWYKAQDSEPRVIVGEDTLRHAGDGRAVRAHLVTHRYVRKQEHFKDKLTWHTAVLLEWDHERFLTLVELATLNGISGRRGMSNWYHDKDDKSGTGLFKALPQSLIAPFDASMSELRVNDVQAKTVEEFGAYLKKYSNLADVLLPRDKQRFLKPVFPWKNKSAEVRLYRNTHSDIARYLVNYVQADGAYDELRRNCQTFAADLFTFLTGVKAKVKIPLMNSMYQRHTEQFVQEPLAF